MSQETDNTGLAISTLAVCVAVVAVLFLLFDLGCGKAPDSYAIDHSRTYGSQQGTQLTATDLHWVDGNGYNCQMTVTLTNKRSVPCRIGWASEVYFADGSSGFGFVFDFFKPGETCWGMYGNIGRPQDGGRDYPSCSEVVSIKPLYAWQDCDDGFSGESGDREEYYELTSQGSSKNDHAEHGGY